MPSGYLCPHCEPKIISTLICISKTDWKDLIEKQNGRQEMNWNTKSKFNNKQIEPSNYFFYRCLLFKLLNILYYIFDKFSFCSLVSRKYSKYLKYFVALNQCFRESKSSSDYLVFFSMFPSTMCVWCGKAGTCWNTHRI